MKRFKEHDVVAVEVMVIAESIYTIFVSVEPGDKKISIPKEHCMLPDGRYPKDFELNAKTTLMVAKWFARRANLVSTAVAE